MILKYRTLKKIGFKGLLFISLCFLFHFPVDAQEVVVKRSDNKVVIEGVKYYLHVVQTKQTLFSISKAYGVSMEDVMRINGKTRPDVKVGEVLRIPEQSNLKAFAPKIVRKEDANFFYHEVKKGDTLFSLSKKYQVALDEIVKANPGSDVSLPLGSTLRIPKEGGEKEPQKVRQEVPQADKDFYYHVIQSGETEYSIVRKYGMKLRKFRKLNPQLKDDGVLKEGMWVRIPRNLVSEELIAPIEVKEEEIVSEKVDSLEQVVEVVEQGRTMDTISIALLLPLYLEANDSINWIHSNEDTLEIVSEREPRILYSRSRDFIRFYEGMLLAVDSLKKQGISVNLQVYDTERSEDRVRRILSKPELSKVDLIVGPVYSNTFDLAADFARNYQIPIVSPLSAKNSKLQTNPYVFQINTSLVTLCEKLADYVTQYHTTQNLVVVHQESYKHLNEYTLVSRIERLLFEGGRFWQNDEVLYKKISFDEFGLYGIEGTLCDTCENIVLIPSTSQPVVDNIVTQLNVLSKRYNIRLMGFPVWQRYDSMDPESFYNLNTTLLSPYYIDYSSADAEKFIRDFRSHFGTEPNDFSFRAYDLCLFFTEALSHFGKDFTEHLNTLQVDLLQGNYSFKRVGTFGGFENRGLHMVNYGSDYKIHHEIPQWSEPAPEMKEEINE